MNRLLIFLLGLLIGAVGVGIVMMRLDTAPPTVPPFVASCPPTPVRAGCPVPEVTAAAPAPQNDQALAVVVPDADAIAPESPSVAALAPNPDPAPETPSVPPSTDQPTLLIPVANVPSGQLQDTFNDARGSGRVHDAIDIMAPRGTPVLAAVDGKVVKLFTSVPGGLTVYQFDADERHAYYYAHLDAYAPGLAEGQLLKRGDVLGTVGYTGNASPSAPHLHFAIFRLGPEKKWWQGTAINPYPLLVSGRSP